MKELSLLRNLQSAHMSVVQSIAKYYIIDFSITFTAFLYILFSLILIIHHLPTEQIDGFCLEI